MSEPIADRPPSRRGFLQRSLALGASGLLLPAATATGADEARLIVRNRTPLDAETPVAVFEEEITPNRLFFVRSHFGPPAVGLVERWTVAVEGGVARPVTLGLEDLSRFEQVSIPAVLQCSGNGRSLYKPTIPGVGWAKGAVGNAEWSGVRLAEVLERAGVKAGMGHVHLHGADGPPMPKTPAYLRSIPLDRATAASTLLVTRMNGEPLPILHGGPVRLAVPGWSGNHWIKWLKRLVVAQDEAPGPYQRTSYKMPTRPLPPGVEPKPEETAPVTVMNVKSLIASPADGVVVNGSPAVVQGVAWTGGEAVVTKVETELIWPGGGTGWVEIKELGGAARPYAWRTWSVGYPVGPGELTVRVRATDSTGAVQPESSPWNKSGYLWNGYDRVDFKVR